MNMPRPIFLAGRLALLVAISGCYYDNEQELYPYRFCNIGDVNDADLYVNKVEPIIQSRCALPGCHVSGPNTAPGDFTQYVEVKAVVDNGRFQTFVLVDRSMPSNGTLSACDLEKLQVWVNAGAPN